MNKKKTDFCSTTWPYRFTTSYPCLIEEWSAFLVSIKPVTSKTDQRSNPEFIAFVAEHNTFGDQVLSVNDVDFTNITHDEAVSLLQSSPRMSMVIRSVGRVPHSTLPYASNNAGASTSGEPWYPESMPHRSDVSILVLLRYDDLKIRMGLSRKGSHRQSDHRLDDAKEKKEMFKQSRMYPYGLRAPTRPTPSADWTGRRGSFLASERLTLFYYCNEYETGAIPVDAFVSVLLEQLDTPEKVIDCSIQQPPVID
ncbi:PDZ domain-containing protein [Caerostris extrusa]|uniref:PDZ domain-containing protein n=1 Tax=Caerostris extrusa TaxID=172846 RepID=A0AAV4Q1D7_CAEEX|nr:PDZ domain-containing protein [Caerostris extrusa]